MCSLYRACNHEDAGYGVSRRDHRCHQCYTVFRPIYRCGAVLYHYRASESDTGLYFLIFIVVLQQIDGNIIGPKILGSSTGLSAFWVVFAILVFGGLWGFPGMLLGVPLMAVIYYVAQKTVSYFLKKRGLTTDTLAYVYLTKVDKESNQPVYDKNPSKKS